MSRITLRNEQLELEFATQGAELRRVYHRQFHLDYLWNADAAYWNRCSPVLFPIVGKLRNNTYQHEGCSYTLTQHGFARDTTFTVEEKTEDQLVFSISSTAQTKLVYPFDFKLYIIYVLKGSSLEVTYKVINTGTIRMYFSIGAHPGFRCPLEEGLAFEDYFLEFEKEETSPRILVGSAGISRKTEPFFEKASRTIPLHTDLFGVKDAIILKDLVSDSISLKSNRSEHGLQFHFKGFPYMGIWTKPGPFLCIEPWYGIADFEDAEGVLKTKEGICSLERGEEFEAMYSVVFF